MDHGDGLRESDRGEITEVRLVCMLPKGNKDACEILHHALCNGYDGINLCQSILFENEDGIFVTAATRRTIH